MLLVRWAHRDAACRVGPDLRATVGAAVDGAAYSSHGCSRAGDGCLALGVHFRQSSQSLVGRKVVAPRASVEVDLVAVQLLAQPDALRAVTRLACASRAPVLTRGLALR